jgi:hypothetical protein
VTAHGRGNEREPLAEPTGVGGREAAAAFLAAVLRREHHVIEQKR